MECCSRIKATLRGGVQRVKDFPSDVCGFVQRLLAHTGIKFCIFIISIQLMVKGILNGVTQRALLPYLKNLGIGAGVYQRTNAAGGSMWGLRGVVGAMSDRFPLFGYHKRYYMLFANIVGILGLLALATTPDSFVVENLWYITISVVFICFEIAVLEIMCAGKYSEVMTTSRDKKSDIVVFACGCTCIGSFIGCSVAGPISDHFGAIPLYYIALPFAIQPLFLIVLGFLPERRVHNPVSACLTGACSGKPKEARETFVTAVVSSPDTDKSVSDPVLSINDQQIEKSVDSSCHGVVNSHILSKELSLFSEKQTAENKKILSQYIGGKREAPGDNQATVQEKGPRHEGPDNRKLHLRMMVMPTTVAVALGGILVLSLIGYSEAFLAYCIVTAVVVVTLSFIFLPKLMAECTVFFFLWGLANVDIHGALDFFYTAGPSCLPDGPHFDYTYYSTYTTVMSTLAEFVGIWVFHRYLSEWTFRQAFWLTCTIRTLSSLFDYMMVMRFNRIFHIPDKVMYILGDAIIQKVVVTLNFLPGLILTSRLCPPGMEATAYAVMDGMVHLGWNLNKYLGTVAIGIAGVKTGKEVSGDFFSENAEELDCNFDNMGMLTLITQVLLPLLVVPLSFFWIPNVSVSCTSPLLHFDSDSTGYKDAENSVSENFENNAVYSAQSSTSLSDSREQESDTAHHLAEVTCDCTQYPVVEKTQPSSMQYKENKEFYLIPNNASFKNNIELSRTSRAIELSDFVECKV